MLIIYFTKTKSYGKKQKHNTQYTIDDFLCVPATTTKAFDPSATTL